jgi:hypothetical protein
LKLADSFTGDPSEKRPFYDGTKADLQVGDLLTAGGSSDYKAELIMNHIYFTALANGAGLAAALAKGDGRERVHIIESTGSFENDPNVTEEISRQSDTFLSQPRTIESRWQSDRLGETNT